jgi:hypothetical protein
MSQFDSGTASSAEALEREFARAAVVRAIVMGRTLHLVTRRYSLLLRAALSLPRRIGPATKLPRALS